MGKRAEVRKILHFEIYIEYIFDKRNMYVIDNVYCTLVHDDGFLTPQNCLLMKRLVLNLIGVVYLVRRWLGARRS